MKIRKAIIPAGGYGTRFSPITKSVPKEMFPIGSEPVIYHVVKELVDSGINDIIIIISQDKGAISDFFSPDEQMEELLKSRKKGALAKKMRDVSMMAKFTFVYTQPPFGNGGCILAAEHLIEKEPFIVVWADELFLTDGKHPRVKQCLDVYEKYGLPVVSAVEIVDPDERCRYGMAKLIPFNGEKKVKIIDKIVEKPKRGKEPSVYATHGAYILTHEFFDVLKSTKPGIHDELWLTDALNLYKKTHQILAKEIEGGRYLDCGVPDSYLYSSIEYMLANASKDECKKIKTKIKRILKSC